MTMMDEIAMLDLLEERAYWRMLLARANAQPGQAGASFQRCIDSLDHEIAEREASCKASGCEMHA
jgi:hypothetical protein